MATSSETMPPSDSDPEGARRRRRRRRAIVYGGTGGVVIAILVAVYFFFFSVVVYRTAREGLDALKEDHPEVEAPSDPDSGLVTTLRNLEPSAAAVVGSGAEAMRTAALAFVEKPEVASALGIPREAEFFQTATVPDPQLPDYEVRRFKQFVDKVRVFGGDIAVSMRSGPSASITGVTIRPATFPALDLAPSIDAAAARAAAISHYASRAADPQNRLPAEAPSDEGELVVFDPERFGLSGAAALAWRIPLGSLNVLVDAKDAHVIVSYDEHPTALNRLTHDCRQTNDCKLVLNEGGIVPPPGPIAADARRAHDGAAAAHAYFKNILKRDGFDDALGTGGSLATESFVQVRGFDNAQWLKTRKRFDFGPGWPTLDITGHEYTHAVTTYGPDLIYLGEAGAVSEFFADFFGAMIERSVTGRTDWRIGDGLPGHSQARPLRNMEEPHNGGFDPKKKYDAVSNAGQPHHFQEIVRDTDMICGSIPGKDSGCVHFNSGILSRALVLAIDGGQFEQTKVTPIGREKAEQIIYRTLTIGVTQSAKILDAANGAITSCKELVGSYGITAADCANLATAFSAVRIPVTP